MIDKEHERLSKVLSHALRHEPDSYGIQLDPEGWAPVEDILIALKRQNEWSELAESDFAAMIASAKKQRHEMRDGYIRALYGHSTADKIEKLVSRPPEKLYHGTAAAVSRKILEEGLKPMGRQYVHLSIDRETACKAGRRKAAAAVLLLVRAGEAYRDGIAFYKGNDSIWLADQVAPEYMELTPARENP